MRTRSPGLACVHVPSRYGDSAGLWWRDKFSAGARASRLRLHQWPGAEARWVLPVRGGASRWAHFASRSMKVNSEAPAPSVERGLEGKVEAGESSDRGQPREPRTASGGLPRCRRRRGSTPDLMGEPAQRSGRQRPRCARADSRDRVQLAPPADPSWTVRGQQLEAACSMMDGVPGLPGRPAKSGLGHS
jgi:hypothetical protein